MRPPCLPLQRQVASEQLAGCKFMLSLSLSFSPSRSSSLRAPLWRWPKQYYKWLCEYLRKRLSLYLCTYPKSMQHFVARKTLKLLKYRVLSAPSFHSLFALHNISEKELENLNVEFHFGAASGRDVKGNEAWHTKQANRLIKSACSPGADINRAVNGQHTHTGRIRNDERTWLT